MTSATIGLIMGGIIAGPVAQYLIRRHKLRSQATEADAGPRGGTRGADHQPRPRGRARRHLHAPSSPANGSSEHVQGCPITLPDLPVVHDARRRDPQPAALRRPAASTTAPAELISGVSLALFLVMTMMALNLVEVGALRRARSLRDPRSRRRS